MNGFAGRTAAALTIAAAVVMPPSPAGAARLFFLDPDTVASGQRTSAYGRSFCPPPCSAVTIRIEDRVVATDVGVAPDGTFAASVMVIEPVGTYRVTASQRVADGTVVSEVAGLAVAASDSPTSTTAPTAQTTVAARPPTTSSSPTSSASPRSSAPTGETSATSAPPSSTGSSVSSSASRNGSTDVSEAAARRSASRDDGRSLLPGAIVAVLVLAATGGAVWVVRRRARSGDPAA